MHTHAHVHTHTHTHSHTHTHTRPLTFLEGMRKGHYQSDISKVMLGEILKDEVEHMWVLPSTQIPPWTELNFSHRFLSTSILHQPIHALLHLPASARWHGTPCRRHCPPGDRCHWCVAAAGGRCPSRSAWTSAPQTGCSCPSTTHTIINLHQQLQN